MVNVAFLRSGRQFAPAHDVDTADTADRTTRHARLEQFHTATLSAHSVARPAAEAAAMATIVNAGFLTSGAQFDSTAASGSGADAADAADAPSPRLGRHARLERFHEQTLAAAAAAAAPGGGDATATHTTSTAATPTVVNLKFLQSGDEFKPATSATAPPQEPTAVPSPKLSRHERLEQFHRRTLAAAATGTKFATTASSSVVNLKFLQSGNEFKPATNTTGARAEMVRKARARARGEVERKSKYERLERFHARTLRAAGGF